MGAYVNPPNASKEEWLAYYGVELTEAPSTIDEVVGSLPVCLVDNGPFTAAGIAYSDRELKEFADPTDMRPKRWYWVPIPLLLEVSNLSNYLDSNSG